MRICGALVVSVLLLVLICVLPKVASIPVDTVQVKWNTEGLQQINNTIEARVNGYIRLRCDGYSNFVRVNPDVYESCNGENIVTSADVLGGCYDPAGFINIELRNTARDLSDSFSITPGETLYFVSFSAGDLPGDPYAGIFINGECTEGFKLQVNIVGVETTEPITTAAPTTEVQTSEPPYSEKPSSISDKTSDKEPSQPSTKTESTKLMDTDIKAQGLSSSGHWFHSTPSLVYLLVLAGCALIR